MVRVIYNDQLVYKVVMWAFFGISLWTEKVALRVEITNISGIDESCGFLIMAGFCLMYTFNVIPLDPN